MKLIHFRCSQLHGFLNYSFDLFDDFSFLHGINGCGKTSVLRAIAALLAPDPVWLLASKYKNISIIINVAGSERTISAERNGSECVIKISGQEDISSILGGPSFTELEILSENLNRPHRDFEELSIRTQLAIEKTPALLYISKLPTPIFLGLDRTTLSQLPSRNEIIHTRIAPRTVHPFFRSQMDDAIAQAEQVLASILSSASSHRTRIYQGLRKSLVLSLFRIPESAAAERASKRDVSQYANMKIQVVSALRKMDISEKEVESIVAPFFDQIISEYKKFIEAPTLKRAANNPDKFDDWYRQTRGYRDLMPYISLIESTLSEIRKANTDESSISGPIERYRSIVNNFFSDSGKELVFRENAPRVRLPSGNISKLDSLSSGERQIFVLITHLTFNPLMDGENILLIDEPELSLHLKWQRQFVDAIRNANPKTQMILATHSPEIIFDRDDRLIPLVNAQ